MVMANLDFYALGDDLRSLFRFIYAETDVVVYELASRFDCDVRRFSSLAELEAVFNLDGIEANHLQLWSPTVMARPVIRRIELRIPGHSFRYAVEGAGLMQLYLDGQRDGIIYHTHYGHWNEASARQRSMHSADDCDWRALSKLSGRIQRHIRSRLSAAKLYARPILHQAFNTLQRGHGLRFGPALHRSGSRLAGERQRHSVADAGRSWRRPRRGSSCRAAAFRWPKTGTLTTSGTPAAMSCSPPGPGDPRLANIDLGANLGTGGTSLADRPPI